MQTGQIMFRFFVPVHQEAPKAVHPVLCAFHSPAPGLLARWVSDRLGFLTMRLYRLNKTMLHQDVAYFLIVIGLVEAPSALPPADLVLPPKPGHAEPPRAAQPALALLALAIADPCPTALRARLGAQDCVLWTLPSCVAATRRRCLGHAVCALWTTKPCVSLRPPPLALTFEAKPYEAPWANQGLTRQRVISESY